MNEKTMKYVKAVAAVAALAGIVITPDQQETITAGFLAVYAIVSALQGKLFK